MPIVRESFGISLETSSYWCCPERTNREVNAVLKIQMVKINFVVLNRVRVSNATDADIEKLRVYPPAPLSSLDISE
jgi:hypothetical protein